MIISGKNVEVRINSIHLGPPAGNAEFLLYNTQNNPIRKYIRIFVSAAETFFISITLFLLLLFFPNFLPHFKDNSLFLHQFFNSY